MAGNNKVTNGGWSNQWAELNWRVIGTEYRRGMSGMNRHGERERQKWESLAGVIFRSGPARDPDRRYIVSRPPATRPLIQTLISNVVSILLYWSSIWRLLSTVYTDGGGGGCGDGAPFIPRDSPCGTRICHDIYFISWLAVTGHRLKIIYKLCRRGRARDIKTPVHRHNVFIHMQRAWKNSETEEGGS